MSKITIKGQKTPTRCEICHKDDVFVPHLNSCFRCDDIEMDELDGANEFNEFDNIDGQDRANQQYQQQHQQRYQQPKQYRIISSPSPAKRTRNYPYKTPLQKVVTGLKLTKMGELPSLPNANANTNANQAFPSMVEKVSYNNTYRPQQIYVSYPKQRGIFFQIGVFTGVIMAVMFLFSLFLTK